MADADAIVVGAGPAGAVTALLLARRGLDVLLLDRSEFPRPKPCGDCLSAAATGLLDRLGLLPRILEAGASRLSHWAIIAPDGTRAVGRLGGVPALALERERLDAVLLDAAVEAGARFRHARVTDLVLRAGRVHGIVARTPDHAAVRLFAPLVIGADGLRSVVNRRLGLIRRPARLRKVSLTAHIPAPTGGLRHGEMHVLDGGCIGYAPAGRDRCNLTLVVTGDRADALGAIGPADFFRSWLGRAPALPSALSEIDPGPLLASGPFDVPTRAVAMPGAALVGDASGYYDPFTGQGIHQALAGAVALADAVGPALGRRPGPGRIRGDLSASADLDHALRGYARRKRRLTRPVRRTQRAVEWILARPERANPIIGRLAAAPAVMDRVVEITGDLRPPASLISPALISSFIFPPAPEPQ